MKWEMEEDRVKIFGDEMNAVGGNNIIAILLMWGEDCMNEWGSRIDYGEAGAAAVCCFPIVGWVGLFSSQPNNQQKS